MKIFFLKIASFVMAFVVLFSTFSFTVSEHYCKGELKNRSIFFKAEKCAMEKAMNETNSACKLHLKKKKCCEDKVDIIEGQDELKTSFYKLSTEEQQFIASFAYTYINSLFEIQEEDKSFSEYPPPLIVRQIYKLDETYLI